MRQPVRTFPYIADFAPPTDEVLLVPVSGADGLLGTLWVIAHDAARKFDREDFRLANVLANLASGAIQFSATRAVRAEDAPLIKATRSYRSSSYKIWKRSWRSGDVRQVSPPAKGLTSAELRNDAANMLRFIARDWRARRRIWNDLTDQKAAVTKSQIQPPMTTERKDSHTAST
jgi:hypothetical protein